MFFTKQFHLGVYAVGIYFALYFPLMLYDDLGSMKNALLTIVVVVSKFIYAYSMLWVISLCALYLFENKIDYIHALYFPLEVLYYFVFGGIALLSLAGGGGSGSGGGSKSTSNYSSGTKSTSSNVSFDKYSAYDLEAEEDMDMDEDDGLL